MGVEKQVGRGVKIPGIKSPLIPTKTITIPLLGRHSKLWPRPFRGPGCRKLLHIYRGALRGWPYGRERGGGGHKQAFMYLPEF